MEKAKNAWLIIDLGCDPHSGGQIPESVEFEIHRSKRFLQFLRVLREFEIWRNSLFIE